MSYTLLTGSTGLIGRYILRDLLASGKPVVAVARGDDYDQRIKNALQETPATISSKAPLHTMKIDLLDASLGLSSGDRQWLSKHVKDVIHCAGDVNFNTNSNPGSALQTNVEGSRRLASTVKELGINDFSYVSTSFVCGNRAGIIFERDLDNGQEFQSEYEESKFLAEKCLRSFDFRRLNVFRPCSVSGDSDTGFTSTFHGIYWFAQFTALAKLWSTAENGLPWHHDVRIFKTGNELHHFIPVNLASRAIVELHLTDRPGNTFHITPSTATRLKEIESALSEYYNYYGVTFCECVTGNPQHNYVESLFYEGLKYMGHRYLDGDPVFDCSNTCRHLPWWKDILIDKSYLLKIFDFATKQQFGKKRKRRMSREAIVKGSNV